MDAHTEKISVRLPEVTLRQIEELAERTGLRRAPLIVVAIKRLFDSEIEGDQVMPELDLTRRYLVQVCGDTFPVIYGPFRQDSGRLRKAKTCQRENPGTVFRLNITLTPSFKIEVAPFSEEELPCPFQ